MFSDKKCSLIKKSALCCSKVQRSKIYRPPQNDLLFVKKFKEMRQNKLPTFSALYGKALQDPLPVPAPSFWLEAKCKSKSTAMPTPPRTHIWKHKYNSTEIQTQNTNNTVKGHAYQIPSIGRRTHIKPTIYKSDERTFWRSAWRCEIVQFGYYWWFGFVRCIRTLVFILHPIPSRSRLINVTQFQFSPNVYFGKDLKKRYSTIRVHLFVHFDDLLLCWTF